MTKMQMIETLTIELSISKLLAFNNRDNPHIVLCSQMKCTTTTEETILHDNNKDYLKIIADNLGTSKQNRTIDEQLVFFFYKD
jgi:hypothetical protein